MSKSEAKSIALKDHMDDSSLYFRECYGLYDTGKKAPEYIYFRGLGDDTIYMHRITTEGSKGKDVSKRMKARVTFPTVTAGFINVRNDGELSRSVYLDRKPIRQFAWGFNNNAYSIIPIDKQVAAALGKSTPRISNYGLLKGAFEEDFPTAKEALRQLRDGEALSVALDKHIALSYRWGANNIQIFNHKTVVGEVVNGGFKLYKGAKHTREAIGKYLGKLIEE